VTRDNQVLKQSTPSLLSIVSSRQGSTLNNAAVYDHFATTFLEKFICLLVLAGCLALNYQPVYDSLGKHIVIVLSLVSFLTPVSGMFFLAASQMIPDPAGFPLSASQTAVLGFAVHTLLAEKFKYLRAALPVLKAVAPFVVWTGVLMLLHGELRQILLLAYAVVTAVAVASLVSQSGGRTTLCLGLLAAGFALCGVTFWGIKLGIPGMVQAFNTQLYGETTAESSRMGSARGNAGMLGPPMAIAIVGLSGVALALMQNRNRRFWNCCVLLVTCLAIGIPPLIGSGVRTGFIALIVGFLTWLFVGGGFFRRNPVAGRVMWIGIALSVLVVAVAWYPLQLNQYWNETTQRQEEQGGIESPLGGRTLEWKAAWDSVLTSPLLGTGGRPVAIYSYEEAPELWASHNTYLDVAMLGGIPGLLFYLLFLSKPLIALWFRRSDGNCLALIAAYLATCVAITGNSALQMKHIWMLWPLLMAVAQTYNPAAKPGLSRRKTRRPMPCQQEQLSKSS
jgi:O-antigen ligase